MKVKVTYTVDLKEVPVETNRLMAKASSKLEFIAHELEKMDLTNDSELKVVESFDHLRKEIFTVDNLLADIEGIIRGYVQTVNAPSQPSQPEETES